MEPRTLEQAKTTKGKLRIYDFDYLSIIGRSDGPMIDLENCDRFRTLVVCTLYHTLDTQKSMKPLFGHPVSKDWLRSWGEDEKSGVTNPYILH